MSRSGIVNVRMVITEEKILSNIDKIQKLINPKSKKQIVQLEEDTYFKDLIESVKTYLLEYPKKKNFPSSVYKSAYSLVEFATNQFEENTKKIETLIRQREQNIALAGNLKELVDAAIIKDPKIRDLLKRTQGMFGEDVINPLKVLFKSKDDTSEEYQTALKLLKAKVTNLESNLHIEIDMERIEDRSKALSYIGIEIADALRTIPTPVEEIKEDIENAKAEEQAKVEVKNEIIQSNVAEAVKQEPVQAVEEKPVQHRRIARKNVVKAEQREQQLNAIAEEQAKYEQETRVDVKPSLWQRIKNSKVGRAISYIMKIRIVIDVPNALPEGRGENY